MVIQVGNCNNDFGDDLYCYNDLFDDDSQNQNITTYDLDDVDKYITNDDSFDIDASDFNEIINNTINKISEQDTKVKKEPSIHSNHRKRVREKFIKFGLEPFSDFEVLEMLLFYSIKQKDTNPLAHALIKRFGSIESVFKADFNDLTEVDGISDVSASLIVFFRELNQYLGNKETTGLYLSTSKDVGRFCCKYFSGRVEEKMIVISMGSANKVLSVDVVSRGTESETAYYPRRIMKAVIKNRANTVILAHNHPGGEGKPDPSVDDVMITDSLSKLLAGFGVVVKDHIICSGKYFMSFSDEGYLKN